MQRNQNDKVKTLLGFAMKAGKVIYGVDNIVGGRHRKFLVITCKSLSEHLQRQLDENLRKVPVLTSKYALLEEIAFRKNCKALAITDKQLSNAILDNFNNNMYDLISEGK